MELLKNKKDQTVSKESVLVEVQKEDTPITAEPEMLENVTEEIKELVSKCPYAKNSTGKCPYLIEMYEHEYEHQEPGLEVVDWSDTIHCILRYVFILLTVIILIRLFTR